MRYSPRNPHSGSLGGGPAATGRCQLTVLPATVEYFPRAASKYRTGCNQVNVEFAQSDFNQCNLGLNECLNSESVPYRETRFAWIVISDAEVNEYSSVMISSKV